MDRVKDFRAFWADLCREMQIEVETLKKQSNSAATELKVERTSNNFSVHRSAFNELEIILDEPGKRVTSLFSFY